MPKDYCNKFRGNWDNRKSKQALLVDCFADCGSVVDLGCGRGEFLSLLEESGIKALGVDDDPEQITSCREAGLDVVHDDIFAFLETDRKFDGIMISHVIEHMDGVAAEKLLKLSYKMLNPGGIILIVTPNPNNLVIMTNIFWLDVTHVRPYPLQLVSEMCIDVGFEIVSAGEDMSSMVLDWRLQFKRKVLGPILRRIGLGTLSDILFSTLCIFVAGQKPFGLTSAQDESVDRYANEARE